MNIVFHEFWISSLSVSTSHLSLVAGQQHTHIHTHTYTHTHSLLPRLMLAMTVTTHSPPICVNVYFDNSNIFFESQNVADDMGQGRIMQESSEAFQEYVYQLVMAVGGERQCSYAFRQDGNIFHPKLIINRQEILAVYTRAAYFTRAQTVRCKYQIAY